MKQSQTHTYNKKRQLSQRLLSAVILILLVGSTILANVILIANNTSAPRENPALKDLKAKIDANLAQLNQVQSQLSKQYLPLMQQYKSEIKAYNREAANAAPLATRDLLVGTGAEVTKDDNHYFSYYIGFCSDENIFDSSFNDPANPTELKAPISGTLDLIAGWKQGVVGMKSGGVREVTIPGELAYANTQEICGGTNSPLRFILLTIKHPELEQLLTESKELQAQFAAMSNGF